jgi:hypothetical protein
MPEAERYEALCACKFVTEVYFDMIDLLLAKYIFPGNAA